MQHLNFAQLPSFDIDLATVLPTLQQHLDQGRTLVQKLSTEAHPSFDTIVLPLNQFEEMLQQFWSPISHLHAVKNTAELREVYQQGAEQISAFYTELGQNPGLYQQYEKLSTEQGLDSAQRKVVTDTLLTFKHSGVSLSKSQQNIFRERQQALVKLTSQFANHVMDATDHWHYHTEDADELSGLPENTKQLAAQKAKSQDQSGWSLGIDQPTYVAVMTYADNADLREVFYTAYTTRASDQGPDAGKWNNAPLINQILQLRQQQAQLLGYPSYTALSLADKMAASTAEVEALLSELAQKARPIAEQELAELKDFAASEGQSTLNPWDIAYYGERLKQSAYQLSDEVLRQYFPTEHVIQGLFDLVQSLFGIEVRQSKHPIATWHQDVTFYELIQNEQPIAGFYTDLYARPNKRGGAWMDHLYTRYRLPEGTLQAPVAYLTCNFTPPGDGAPSLLKHDDVETLFHEFGHVLHHLVSQVDYLDVSGINGVEWDAIELPSQFMENFCWDQNVLSMMSRHYQTGETIPDTLYQALQKTRTFQAGMQTLRQVEFALFDLHIHSNTDPDIDVQAELDRVRSEVAVLIPPAFNRFQNSFGHIFAGGYAAGYYSYKWAEVLSADAFEALQVNGTVDHTASLKFYEEILTQGGSAPMAELYLNFRGQPAATNALIKQLSNSA